MKSKLNNTYISKLGAKGGLFFQRGIRALILALIFCAPVRLLADNITATITVDNGYAFGFGDANGIFPGQFYGGVDNCSSGAIFGNNCYVFVPPDNPNTDNGPEIYNITADWTNYLYIVAWSDDSGLQGTVASFTDNDTGNTVTTSPAWPWQVYATGTNWAPDCTNTTHGPPLTGFPYAINNQIAIADAGSGGPGTSVTWVGNTATPNGRLDFSGEFNGNTYPIAAPSCIPTNATWMEYNPEPSNPSINPFSWQGYPNVPNFLREYLIYRIGTIGQIFTTSNTCNNGCITIVNPNDIKIATCSNSLPVTFLVHVVDSCCPNYTLTSVPASGFDFPLGTTTVTSTVTDTCGHTNSCTFTVTVIQNTNAPIIYGCPTNITLCGTNGCGAMPDVTSEVQAVTATGGTNVTITQSIPPGTVVCGDTNVIFTVSDACGDATNCTVPCILETNPPAIIYCPPDIIICTNSSGCGYMPDATSELQAAAVGGGPVAVTQNIPPGTLICNDTNVIFTVTDGCGNATNCTVPCTLIDCSSNCFQIQCWTNIVVTSCTNLPVYYNPTAADGCCSNWFSYCTPSSGSIFDVGTTQTVTFTVVDACGNSNGCTFTVTVNPGTDCTNPCPSLVCSNLVIDTCNSCTNVSLTNAVSYSDPCCSSNTVSLQFFEGTTNISPAGTCFPVDTTTPVTVVATDGCGGAVTNTFTVTVNPAFPQVQAPGNVVIESCTNVTVAAYPLPLINDPCCTNWTIVYDPPLGSTFPPNSHTLVNWYAYDCLSGTNYFAANSFLVIVFCTNCCEGPITNYTVTVVKGSNYLADCLCQAPSNTLAQVIPSVPEGTEVYFWNPNAGQFNPVDTFTSGAWQNGTELMFPAEGFLLVNPTNQYSLTIYGIDPECNPGCSPLNCFSATVLVGGNGLNPNPMDFCDLYCCAPPAGTEVQGWDAATQSFTTYTYVANWPPPPLPVGYSEFVSVNSNACLAAASNLQIVSSGTSQGSGIIINWSTNGIPNNYWQPQYSTDLVHWLTLPITGALIPPVIINTTGTFTLSAPYQFFRLASTNTSSQKQ